ncbi:MAG: DUF2779 domain-containing protein, partial [Spirochaetaceae bacterium]
MAKKKSMTLTKSKYLAGLKCHKYLWTMIHAPDKIPGIDQASEHRFLEGYIIEKLAKEQFHGGITIAKDDFLKNINDTRECLSKKKPLFEAGFLTGNLSVRV